MKQSIHPRRFISVLSIFVGLVIPAALRAQATQPATQPAAADSPEVKEVRATLLKWDADVATMSLVDYRKTFHTENDREAEYSDYLAHDTWESSKTEQAVRDKWGADADTQFCRLMGFTTREEDQACDIKVDGDQATLTWNIKDVDPEKMIKIDGHWYTDVHGMWDDWIAKNPQMETFKRPLITLMKQMRSDISDGKYDDADSCIKDLQTKLGAADGN